MALLQINPGALETLKTTAAAKAASVVAQRLSPLNIQRVQQLLKFGNFLGGIFGDTGENDPQPLLGGVTLAEARETYAQLQEAQLARKNLFFVRVIDYNPPPVEYAEGSYFTTLFNLFALDVSYASGTLTGDKVPLGSAVLDKLTGSEPRELQITTLDDARGSLKTWFDAKKAQAARPDGTFGLPSEYWLDIEVFHAVPKPDERAYKLHTRMRPQTAQLDLSRRDQAMSEVQMTFTEFNTFVRP